MKNPKYLFFILLFFLPLFSQSQTVKIKGLAKTYENKDIGVYIYRDFISNTEKQLTFSAIDSTGHFLLEFESREIQYITLKIDKNIAAMYVEPNATYEIIVMPPDSNTYQNPNLEHDVKISINLKSKTEINALMMDYEKRFDKFLTKEYPAFVNRNPHIVLDSFKIQTHRFYADVKNIYFDSYVTYSIAALEEKTLVSRKKLYTTYLDQKPIQFNNQEYFNFFNSFYKQYLLKYSQKGNELKNQIETNSSLGGCMNVLKKDDYLHNDTIRELVLIKGLYEGYYDGTLKKASVVKLLEHITDEGKIGEDKQIAQNILNSFSPLKPGAIAPGFELPDKTGTNYNLSGFRSRKFVYLFFFDQKCTACMQQMKIISSLKKQYGNKIEFIAVSLDKTPLELKNFCLKNPEYDWLFLYNTDPKLKSLYEIKSLPAYFLIDVEGKFIQAPADSPEGDIDRAFYDLCKPKGKRHNVGDKSNY